MSVYTAIVPKISKIVAGKPRLGKSYQQFASCDISNLRIPQKG